jgi:uncharacterized RDD family membrane protein YckC
MSETPSYTPPAGTGPSGPRSSFWRRLAALLVDGIVLGIVGGILGAIFDADRNASNGIATLLGLAYFTYFEGSSGQTPGKKALGIRTIDFSGGGAIGFGRAFIRYIGRIVSTIALLIGYLWMIWDKEKQTWHDKFANSVVVPESAYPVEKWP